MTNMGTTGSPEGLPHYLTKHFMAQRLGKCLRDDIGFWFCFVEKCDACEGGFVIENILDGVQRVEYETPFLGYQPDILLWGKSQEKPLRVVEVVATSEPSAGKRRMFKEQGVDLYIVRSRTAEQAQAVKQCIDSFYILPAESQVFCRRKARMRLSESLRRLEAQDDARLGVQSNEPTQKELNDAQAKWAQWLKETPEDERPAGPVYRLPPTRRSQTYWIGSRMASRSDLLNLVQFFRYLSVGHKYFSNMWMVREQVDRVWASVLNQNGPFDQPYEPGEWPTEHQSLADFKRGSPSPPLRPGTIEWESARGSSKEFCHLGRLLWPDRANANPGKWCTRCGGVKNLTVWQAEGQYICEGCRPAAQEFLDFVNSPDFEETPVPPEVDELFRSVIAELERPITRKDWDPEWGR